MHAEEQLSGRDGVQSVPALLSGMVHESLEGERGQGT